MYYQVIFDISNFKYADIQAPLISFSFALIGLIWVILRNSIKKIRFLVFYSRWYEYSIIGFILLWSLITIFSYCYQYFEIKKAYNDGKAIVVEGYVSSYVPMPHGGHGYEKFTVNGYQFEYSDNDITPWFNMTKSTGSPIKSGLYVRISFIVIPKVNAIVKLEILKK